MGKNERAQQDVKKVILRNIFILFLIGARNTFLREISFIRVLIWVEKGVKNKVKLQLPWALVESNMGCWGDKLKTKAKHFSPFLYLRVVISNVCRHVPFAFCLARKIISSLNETQKEISICKLKPPVPWVSFPVLEICFRLSIFLPSLVKNKCGIEWRWKKIPSRFAFLVVWGGVLQKHLTLAGKR